MEKKKIGLLGAILMGIGCIVGSGIFGTLPTVANEYGAGVVWALIGAAAVVVLRALASTYSSAALPASGSQFLWAAKLMHPIAGAFVSFFHTADAYYGIAVWRAVRYVSPAPVSQYGD